MKKALAIILTIVATLSSVTLISNAQISDKCAVGMKACSNKLGEICALSFDEYKKPEDFYKDASNFYGECLKAFCSKDDFKDNLLFTRIFKNPYSFVKIVKENVDKALEHDTDYDHEKTMAEIADAYNVVEVNNIVKVNNTYPAYGINAFA